ncbi:MAG: hypothetical protein QOH38_2013, partial [Thermoleophilaceae bacterium]|nr:hypothetical protein [Thermoleophilaceae bacterium]
MTLGSDLTKTANHVEQHGADAAFWQELIGGANGAMPVDGQVTLVKLKGSVLDDPQHPRFPDPQFHVQVLRPDPTGTTVEAVISSRPFRLPVTVTDSQVITQYEPVNLCVSRGNFVDFNDIGGNEWSWGTGPGGMHVQIFSDSAGDARTRWYSNNGRTNNGDTFDLTDPKAHFGTLDGEELLMQVRLATGPDATDICPGGYRQHVFHGLELRDQPARLRTVTRTVTVRGGCPFATYGRCAGTLALTATIGGRTTSLGATSFDVKPGATGKIDVGISGVNAKLIRKARRVTGTAIAKAHDAPGSDTRAASNKPPVQSATTSGRLLIQSDLPPTAKKPKKKKDGDGD